MMVFDRKGQENFSNHALRNPASSANDKLGTLGENVGINWDVAKYQHLGISESLNFREPIQNQFKLMYDLTGNEQYNKRFLSHQIVGAKKKAGEASQKDFDLNKRFFESQHDAIIKLQALYPDAGLVTWSQMSEKRNEELKQMNIDLQKLQDRSQTFDVSVGNVASMGAYFMDPELLATLPFSGGASVGGRIAANAWRSFKIESGLAFLSETVIAPKVYDFQHQIGNEEYGVKDAAIRIMTATLAAGVIRAGGSVTIDLSKIGIAKAKLIKQGKPNEAHVLDYYAKLQEDAKTVEEFINDAMIAANTKEYARPVVAIEADIAHLKNAIKDTKAVLSKIGKDKDSSILKGQKKDLAEKELQLEVLIKEQQQYLLSKTNETTTYANQFVSAHIAAQTKVAQAFESGKFISQKEIDDALGVNSMALAKRVIGDDAQEIGLDKFIAKPRSEAVTLEELAREFKTAKAFIEGLHNRSVKDPQWVNKESAKDPLFNPEGLTPDSWFPYVKSVLARNFIDENLSLYKQYPKEFRKALDELGVVWSKKDKSWVRPPKDIDAYYKGKEKLKKVSKKDLESVWKEGQKSIKAIKDARTKVIEEILPRLIDDKETLAKITSLANTKGPVSDAINVAAQRIKDGESVQRATRDILPELRRSGESELNARFGDDGAGDGQPALTIKEQIDNLPAGVTKLVVEPKDAPGLSIGILEKNGKARAVVEIDRSKIDIDCDNFCYPELKPTLKDGHVLLQDTQKKYQFKNGKYKPARAKKHKEYIDSKLAKGTTAAKGEKPIVWLMGGGGASGKGTVLKKLQEDGIIPEKGFVHIDPDNVKLKIDEYKALSKQGDYRAASVVHGESSDIAKALQVAATDKKLNMIIDKTLGKEEKALKLIQDLKDSGYDVRLVGVTIDPSEALVRAQIRYFSSGRLVPPKMIIKAHKGFNAAFPAYAKKVDLAFLYDNTIKVVEIASARKGKITIVSKEAYNISQARGKLNETTTTHKQLRESQGLPGRLDGQDTPVIKNDSGGTQAADRGTHLRGDGEGRESKKLDGQSKNSEPNLDQIKIQEAQKLIDDLGDDFQMVSGVKDSGKGDTVLEFKTARETFKEIDNEQKLVDDLLKCVGS